MNNSFFDKQSEENNKMNTSFFDKQSEENNKMNYDYIIVGGGPGGLTLATLLEGKILLIEKESTLGGCHRVKRVDGLFTEHGPRIYGTSYINCQQIVSKLGLTWNDYFVPYNFQFLSLGISSILTKLSLGEIASLIKGYIQYFFGLTKIKLSIGEFMIQNNFSDKSTSLIDDLCRSTDGADKTRYLVNSFFNLLNQNFFF